MLDASTVHGELLTLEDGTELAVTRYEDLVLVDTRGPLRLTQGDVERVRAALAFMFLEPRA